MRTRGLSNDEKRYSRQLLDEELTKKERRYLEDKLDRARMARLKSRREDRVMGLTAAIAGLAVLLGGLGWGPAILAAFLALVAMGLTAHWWNT